MFPFARQAVRWGPFITFYAMNHGYIIGGITFSIWPWHFENAIPRKNATPKNLDKEIRQFLTWIASEREVEDRMQFINSLYSEKCCMISFPTWWTTWIPFSSQNLCEFSASSPRVICKVTIQILLSLQIFIWSLYTSGSSPRVICKLTIQLMVMNGKWKQ